MSCSLQYLTKCVCSNMVKEMSFTAASGEGGRGRRRKHHSCACPRAFGFFSFVWVVQLESAVFHQTNGSQQVGSLTWLNQDECHKSYRSQRIRAGEMNSGSPGSLWTSVKVCDRVYQGPLFIGHFFICLLFSWEEASPIPFFSDLWRKVFATSAVKLCYSKEIDPDPI